MSQLKSIVIDLESSLERAFNYAAHFINIDSDINVTVDATLVVTADKNIDNIVKLKKEGIITAADALNEIRARMLMVTEPEGRTNETFST